MHKRSIAGEFTKSLLTSTLVLGALTGILWIAQTQQIFKAEAAHVYTHESVVAKAQAKAEAEEIVNYIGYREDDLVLKINQQVQSRVNEGVLLAQAIMEQNRGKSTSAVQQAVISGLRMPRFFEGRGYFFITSLQGEAILYPPRPELEGTLILNGTDSRGQKTVETEIATVRSQEEGLVTGYWPRPQDPDGESRLKISYIKRLEPYDWYIGCGEYYDDVKLAVRQDIIERYRKYGSNNGLRVFILDDSGKELVPRYPEDGTVKGVPDVIRTEEERKAVISEEMAYAVSNPAGYGYMRSYASSAGELKETAVYIRPIPRWGWIVGVELPVEAAHNENDWTLSQVRQRSLQTLVQILVVMSFVFMASIAVLRRQSLRLRNDFMAFMTFFKRAAKENVLIEIPNIQMQEFASLANMANQMVARRQEAENELMESKERLEIQVQERTQELQDSLQILESTQDQLMQNEKLAVLGNLVAGITHEINIPVGIARSLNSDMQDLIETVRTSVSKEDAKAVELQVQLTRMAEDTALLDANLKRTLELVESFKEVSVDQCSGQRRAFNLQSYLEEIMLSLSSRIRKGGHHVEIICDDTVEIIGYPGSLSQIITNLVMNSLQHGFKNRTGGHITVEIIDGGERVLMLYRDDGWGIPSRDIHRVFEPFFTSDKDRTGSGLGLTIVQQLVTEKLGGAVNLTSTEGRGVLFEIEFPRVQGKI